MNRYAYAFHRDIQDDEVFIRFPEFPEIFSTIPREKFKTMSVNDIQNHASDAVITALQARIVGRGDIPSGDNPNLVKADGFVILSVQQAMKLELFRIYKENCRSISEFGKIINKKETAVRRMLNLRHPSLATEIEVASEVFGKRIVHSWDIEPAGPSGHSARPLLASARPKKAPDQPGSTP